MTSSVHDDGPGRRPGGSGGQPPRRIDRFMLARPEPGRGTEGPPDPARVGATLEDSRGIYTSLDALPVEWRDPAASPEAWLPSNWHWLEWPRDGEVDTSVTNALGAVDRTGWKPMVSTSPHLLGALRWRATLRPRPQLQFGDRVVGAGYAWLAFEMPAPTGLELYCVQVAQLPVGRTRFDLDRYGSKPPVGAFCTSLDAVLRYTAPWRRAAQLDSRLELLVSASEGLARA
ncbi:hypothetical protein BH11ACT8_BH11ACT8_13130 [soil metagenome]